MKPFLFLLLCLCTGLTFGRITPAILARSVRTSTPGSTAPYRYLKLDVSWCPAFYMEIWEIDFMVSATAYPTSTMTADNAPSPLVVTYSDVYTTWGGYRAFDNDTATQWHTDGASNSHWLILDLGSGNDITPTAVVINCNLSNGSRYPRDFRILGSNTGLFAGEEVVLLTVSGETSWVDDTPKTFTF